ncbi:MAG: acetyl-coenzyme synthetase, partial [Candidatus Eremiobacteraeota bacterium]|nr:acetyl-coenzyme synthetase [Candidatus Eremiobacteraeota bacterium]
MMTLVDFVCRGAGTRPAFSGSDGIVLDHAGLCNAADAVGSALAVRGVEPGDRVAIFLPMSPEVAVASHACAHIGAIQMPVFSGFAGPAVAQ